MLFAACWLSKKGKYFFGYRKWKAFETLKKARKEIILWKV